MPRCHILGCICTIAIALFCSTARADLIINFAQVGNDVVATGSGSANLSGLTLFDSFPGAQINLDAATGNFRGGNTSMGFARYRFLTIAPTGYGSFNVGFGPGTGGSNFPSSATGDYFGLTAFNSMLLVPQNYVSGTQLSNTTTWINRTLANLGLAPVGSTFTYTWGSGVDADSLTINITAVPEPSSVLCLTLGLSCVALFRREKLSNPLLG